MAEQPAGYIVTGLCGRQWFVPLAAVGRDHAEFLRDNDGLSDAEATTQSERHRKHWPVWFAEQCAPYWPDIERLGRLIQPAGRFKTKRANDRLRDTGRPDWVATNTAPAA